MADAAQEPDPGRFDFYGAHYRRFGDGLAAALRREAYGGGDVGQTPPEMAIAWRTGDVFDDVPDPRPDFIVTSQFTHHLPDAEIVRFLRWMERPAARGWFIADLHRHAFAYHGFGLLARVARWHRIVREDGMLSVARSFRREDWVRLLAEAGVEAEISWHVPFRICVSRRRPEAR